jgi:hypothetical protein
MKLDWFKLGLHNKGNNGVVIFGLTIWIFGVPNGKSLMSCKKERKGKERRGVVWW